ncbi:hypothetical protein Skr01_24580 [Sphaerisporangium krabiense]|uniref:Outer membrane murein-binding lipoprotein Lpp n=1 Tax=Sphaerisporangium krabiense TaxID=763782 RepID=A0A7W9DUS0_9ACTN|nr:hypothetical protein [Sphaerisporangium krabiense]MBB5630670.1 outer membrane murein-binding lipoprotein Lpp [Sphaerisporangium krabiense]GII62373.1 hypothetical protein Skr01_24580 [Sphaerisporangium krabiense]
MPRAGPGRVRLFAVLFLLTFILAAVGGVLAGMKITALRDEARTQADRLQTLQSQVSTVGKETDQLRRERDAARKDIAALEKEAGTSLKDVTQIFRDGLRLSGKDLLEADVPEGGLSVPLRQTSCVSDFDNWTCSDFTTISAKVEPCDGAPRCLTQTWLTGPAPLSQGTDQPAWSWSATGTPAGVQFTCAGEDVSDEMTWRFTMEPLAAAFDAGDRRWRISEYSAEFHLETSGASGCPAFAATWTIADGMAP